MGDEDWYIYHQNDVRHAKESIRDRYIHCFECYMLMPCEQDGQILPDRYRKLQAGADRMRRSNGEPCKANSSLQPFEVGSYSFRLFVVSIANNRIRVKRVAILSYALLKHTVQNRL